MRALDASRSVRIGSRMSCWALARPRRFRCLATGVTVRITVFGAERNPTISAVSEQVGVFRTVSPVGVFHRIPGPRRSDDFRSRRIPTLSACRVGPSGPAGIGDTTISDVLWPAFLTPSVSCPGVLRRVTEPPNGLRAEPTAGQIEGRSEPLQVRWPFGDGITLGRATPAFPLSSRSFGAVRLSEATRCVSRESGVDGCGEGVRASAGYSGIEGPLT